MPMLIPKIPHKLGELLGPEGRDEFVDFLNQAFHASREDVVQVVGDRFERRLVEETSKLAAEIGSLELRIAGQFVALEVRIGERFTGLEGRVGGIEERVGGLERKIGSLEGKIGSLEGRIDAQVGGLRGELKEDMGALRAEMKSDFALLHRDMAVQTRWILVVLLAAGVLYPILNQVLARLLPG